MSWNYLRKKHQVLQSQSAMGSLRTQSLFSRRSSVTPIPSNTQFPSLPYPCSSSKSTPFLWIFYWKWIIIFLFFQWMQPPSLHLCSRVPCISASVSSSCCCCWVKQQSARVQWLGNNIRAAVQWDALSKATTFVFFQSTYCCRKWQYLEITQWD